MIPVILICMMIFGTVGAGVKYGVPASEADRVSVQKTYTPNVIKLVKGDPNWVEEYTTTTAVTKK